MFFEVEPVRRSGRRRGRRDSDGVLKPTSNAKPMVAADQQQDAIMKEIGTAVRHMAVYGVGGILVKAVGFFMLPFYTHYLTPTEYGILEVLDLSMSVFGVVLSMG